VPRIGGIQDTEGEADARGRRVLASRLLAELAAEDDFDRAIAHTADKLASLAREALAEHCAGLTEKLDPEQ
jgi:hypothetical protein